MSKIMPINRDLLKLKMRFYHIFRNNDPFGAMFDKRISQKILLYPINGYHLSEKQFNALIKTLESFNEPFFYLSEIEGNCFSEKSDGDVSYRSSHWKISSTVTYDEYISCRTVLENALYSLNGKWGLIVSHEGHAVFGGEDNFVELFKQMYSSWSIEIDNFIKMCEYNKERYDSNLEWLPGFLDYIRGR